MKVELEFEGETGEAWVKQAKAVHMIYNRNRAAQKMTAMSFENWFKRLLMTVLAGDIIALETEEKPAVAADQKPPA